MAKCVSGKMISHRAGRIGLSLHHMIEGVNVKSLPWISAGLGLLNASSRRLALIKHPALSVWISKRPLLRFAVVSLGTAASCPELKKNLSLATVSSCL